jgi:16S rRNA (uracil1498-N3)-methyltransferase
MIPRLYCPQPLVASQVIDLPAAAAHHARRVLRLEDGDAVILFNGLGGEVDGCLVNGSRVRLDTVRDVECEAPLAVTLVQALPAGDKMDWVVQKAVELGVACIQPVIARRSIVQLSGERAKRRGEHWQQVAVAACEQCGRNRVPAVLPLVDLLHYLSVPVSGDVLRWILLPTEVGNKVGNEADNDGRLADNGRPNSAVTLLVGPESGFDASEVLSARNNGFVPRRLGPRILRSETAGLAALAAMQALWGDY